MMFEAVYDGCVCVQQTPSTEQNIVICKKFYELAIMVPVLCVYTVAVLVVVVFLLPGLQIIYR